MRKRPKGFTVVQNTGGDLRIASPTARKALVPIGMAWRRDENVIQRATNGTYARKYAQDPFCNISNDGYHPALLRRRTPFVHVALEFFHAITSF